MLALAHGRILILDNWEFEIERKDSPINFDLPSYHRTIDTYIENESDNYIFDYIPVDSL